jgi:hypothetical protein
VHRRDRSIRAHALAFAWIRRFCQLPTAGNRFINAQPRFGIYRDWRAETQTIYFDKIMFWNADPSGHPDWGITPPPG